MKSKTERICKISPINKNTRIYDKEGILWVDVEGEPMKKAMGEVEILATNDKQGRTMSVMFSQKGAKTTFMITFPADGLDDLFYHMQRRK